MSSIKERIELFYDYDIDTSECHLWLGSNSDNGGEESGTDYIMAERAIKGLRILDKTAWARNIPIEISMINFGGDEFHGWAIYDAIRACRSEVSIAIYGAAISAGALVMQAADRRYMSPHSRLMVHYGEAGYQGHAIDMIRNSEAQKKLHAQFEDVLLWRLREKNPAWTRARLKNKINNDWWLTPAEALEVGLIDGIINNE